MVRMPHEFNQPSSMPHRAALNARGKPGIGNPRMAEMEAALAALQEQALEIRYTQKRRRRRWIAACAVATLVMAVAGYGYGVVKADKIAEQQAAIRAAAIIEQQKHANAAEPTGIRLEPSTNQNVLRVQKKAAGGDLKAQYELAMMYERGEGVAVDKPLAQSLLSNAAAAGYPVAMMELGSAYLTGRFGEPDKHAALRWLEAAATSGSAVAAFKLGELYEDGLDGAPDNALALGWYQRAAGLGSDPALVSIARLTPKKPPLTNEDVKRIQQALRALGYNVGFADGKLGKQTVDAIKAYQTQAGMMANGNPSHLLLEKLEEERVMQGG